MLIDGPAVLGWQQWRELEARFGLGMIAWTTVRGCSSKPAQIGPPLQPPRRASKCAMSIRETAHGAATPHVGLATDAMCGETGRPRVATTKIRMPQFRADLA